MAPVIAECRRPTRGLQPIVCFTGQHREMVIPVINYFNIELDVDLDLMRPNQTLAGLTARCLEQLDATLARIQPDCVVAQGDTTTVMAASMAAFYRRIPLVHVEAGLRTGNILSPWPEEFNRCVTGLVADLHCAPTLQAARNLDRAGVPREKVAVTGNTVIDALLRTLNRERANSHVWTTKYEWLGKHDLVLITGHRRENFGAGFDDICHAIGRLAERFPTVKFVYPVHLNPNVQEPVRKILSNRSNVHLLPPVGYPEFVWLMDRSKLILTDSGGVQEEAPSLKKPVLVMRDTTERPEALEAGAVRLVGTSQTAIVNGVTQLLNDRDAYARCQIDQNPYGDGNASRQIVDLMSARYHTSKPARRAA